MRVFCLFIMLLLPAAVFCQTKIDEPLFRIWDIVGKEGFIDVGGNVVIKPQFDAVGEFSEGLAPVSISGKWGYINRKGEVVIQPRWEESKIDWERRPMVQSFQDGLAIVIEEINVKMMEGSYRTYKCGYINSKGEYLIQPKFRQSCGVFSDGLAQIKVDILGDEYEKEKGAIGFINKKGNWAIKPQFVEAGSFVNGLAQVRDDYYKPFYSIDKIGYKVEGKIDCRYQHSFKEGLALIYDEKTGVKKFINEQCEEVFKVPSDITTLAGEFTEGMLIVGKEINGNKMLGYLDRTGKVAIDFKFAKTSPFSDGLAGVEIEEEGKRIKAYINPKGEIVLKNTRDNASFKNGLALQFLKLLNIGPNPNGRIRGYMNKQGKYVWLSPNAEVYLEKDWIKENFIN